MTTPRTPTHRELIGIAWASRGDETFSEMLHRLKGSSVAIFDDYISDGPGFVGRVAVVVWGYPEAFDAFSLAPGADERTGWKMLNNYKGGV